MKKALFILLCFVGVQAKAQFIINPYVFGDPKQFYTATVSGSNVNIRYFVTQSAPGGWYSNISSAYIPSNTNYDVQSANSTSVNPMSFNYFGANDGAKTFNYEIYQNGVLQASGSGSLSSPAVGSTSTGAAVGFPSINTGSANSMWYIKVW